MWFTAFGISPSYISVLWKLVWSQESNYMRFTWLLFVFVIPAFQHFKTSDVKCFFLVSRRSNVAAVKYRWGFKSTFFWLKCDSCSCLQSMQLRVAAAVTEFKLGQVTSWMFTTWRFTHDRIETRLTTQPTYRIKLLLNIYTYPLPGLAVANTTNLQN